MEEVTILVHGTFANPGYGSPGDEAPPEVDRWWRVSGNRKSPNMADRLQEELGNVWEPGRDERDGDLSYEDLGEWSGENTHKARVKAAKRLAGSLAELAERRGCDPGDPLLVNFVAHSHGGNVVLESLEHLADNVRARQVCLLGTPLTWRFPDLRAVYFPGVIFFSWQTSVLFGDKILPPILGPSSGGQWFADTLMTFGILVPILLWLAAVGLMIVRGASVFVRGQPAYGPRPDDLGRCLRGRPAVLFISDQDEADLMLQLGAAPIDAYRAMVAGQPTFEGVRTIRAAWWRPFARYLELAYARPISYAIVAPAMEMALEAKALGFPAWHVAFSNYEMVSWLPSPYEDDQIRYEAVRKEELRADDRVEVDLTDSIGFVKERRRGLDRRRGKIHALRVTVLDTFSELLEQVRLRHSGYYTSPEISARVAKTIAS